MKLFFKLIAPALCLITAGALAGCGKCDCDCGCDGIGLPAVMEFTGYLLLTYDDKSVNLVEWL